MKEKNKNILIGILMTIIIVLLTIIILITTGIIKKDNNNKDITNNNKDITNNDEVIQNNIDWTEYILSSHILEAKISRIRSKDLGDNVDINKTITIEMSGLKELLSKIKENQLTKVYSLGRGGLQRDTIEISYEKNDNKYEITIINGSIAIDTNDTTLVEILDKQKYKEENIEYKNQEGSFYYYRIENYNETIFDKYYN